jgi:hypothetical protein
MNVTVSGLYFGFAGTMITLIFLTTPTTGSVTVTVRVLGYGAVDTLLLCVPTAIES